MLGDRTGWRDWLPAQIQAIVDAWFLVVRAFSWLAVRAVAILLFPTAFLAYGLALRAFGKDPLDRSLTEDRSSYWSDPELTNEDLEMFRRQY